MKRLIEIAIEVDKLAAPTDRQGSTFMSACKAANAIEELRAMLEKEQRYQRKGTDSIPQP